ncbi:radical SAM family heme chaperone HemW [Akkermansiaceae bacterium]|nr:radical SAM family heme chaperone HemW [Verrucomicrobiota bacterium]MDA7651956.1 radical SAM family heme chaperone HemW [Akkermansiaceae bacterium]MDB2639594.1 radical SAM family heme chaperone HemW [Akkermansiaceae bacterium]
MFNVPHVHLYLHIPFCHRICPYCSFYKHTPGKTDLGAFVEAILDEARFAAKKNLPPLKTIYFGGGTPSMLSPTHLRRLFTGLRTILDFSAVGEVTLEANPATFTSRTAHLYEELGVTRVSLGVQSFIGKHLETLGREHSPMQAITSVHLLREVSNLEINIDLIFSVPGQSLLDWEDTLTQALALQPDHLSAYNLTYEEDTAFFEKFQTGAFQDDSNLNAEMFSLGEELLSSAGYEHYETSNYALPRRRSRHNEGYWIGNDYLGLGPSAVSTLNRTRHQNVCDTPDYLKRIKSIGHAQEKIEILDDEAWRLERIALQLRTKEGLPLKYLLPDANLGSINHLVRKTATHLQLINDGPLLVDSIAAELA